ncbi:unnamed protein product, partial [Rotaria socialis]
MGQHVPSDPSL